jgi:putative membrane-bound dehydrogenase-like protein
MPAAARLAVLLPLITGLASAAEPAPRPPLTLREAVAQFRLPAGLRIEPVAAEPQIESPVAAAFDEDGRLWVVEMRDYPNGPRTGEPPGGRIKCLTDRDGDGFFETSTLFADGLLFANGLLPWRGGLIVTAAPHILYLKDTDGDGRADERRVLFEGFAAANPQLRVSHPVLGPDGWVYCANGLRGGKVRAAGRADAPVVDLSGRDFRFDPDSGRYEAVSGPGQFGNTFDDWGRRFVCDNRRHLRHVVLPERALRRNPDLAVPGVLEDTCGLESGPLSSGVRVYPLSAAWTTSSLHAGRFTAACGVFAYRGDRLPHEFRGVFTAEPTGNLVHLESLRPHGATFRSRPFRDGVEFLATRDEWFRPVSMLDAPDGALYVVDMYRAVIEHPEFMPAELKTRPDLTLGRDRGRIWRIVPDAPSPAAARPRLSNASARELAALLAHPGGWWRTTARRLLLDRPDAEQPLLSAAVESPQAQARMLALWLLSARGELSAELAVRMLTDPHPRVRENAAQVAETFLAGPQADFVGVRLAALASDPDPAVRYHAALALGAWRDPRALTALADIAAAGADDPWTRAAVAAGLAGRAGRLLSLLMADRLGEPAPDRLRLVRDLGELLGAGRDPAEIAAALTDLRSAGDYRSAAVLGLADGLSRRGQRLADFAAAHLSPEQRAPLDALFGESLAAAGDARLPVAARTESLRLAAQAPWSDARPVLLRLLAEDPAEPVRAAAARALAGRPETEAAPLLMAAWSSSPATVRREITESLLAHPRRVLAVLDGIEAGKFPAAALDPLQIRRLIADRNPAVAARATKLLADRLPPRRTAVLEAYQPALKLPADPARGREVFRRHCAACHVVAGIGTAVGPDIGDTRTKTPAMLLGDILDPNAAIDGNYMAVMVRTKDEKVLTGVIASQTAAALVLRQAGNRTETVLLADIDDLRSTGLSLMPEGLEKDIPPPAMADLLAFLKNWRYMDGKVPAAARK